MPKEAEGVIMCDVCPKAECQRRYPDGVPSYCLANKFDDVIEETKALYISPEVINIYKASGQVVTKGYRKWPRIQEALEFARELGVKKVGIASCIGLRTEAKDIAELFKGAGFTVVCASCQIGAVGPVERGLGQEYADFQGLYCNPITQAEIMNREGTELNYVVGLCLGHDILFNRFSKAPASTLIVKDRVTGNNPEAALYSSFHRDTLWKTYCPKKKG
ncbi:MAG: DUF1847 domain-containing protein [Chloroflexota bacterium]|nr:DUF1847 domain-containing protein [Chloroflexota bacterium]